MTAAANTPLEHLEYHDLDADELAELKEVADAMGAP